jgi:hypothetical protein
MLGRHTNEKTKKKYSQSDESKFIKMKNIFMIIFFITQLINNNNIYLYATKKIQFKIGRGELVDSTIIFPIRIVLLLGY